MAHRFPRRARLQKPGEYKAAFASGSRYSDRLLTAVVAPNALNSPRLGLAVPKKAIVLATGRNRVKRITRESFRQNQGRLPAVDIVVTAKHAASAASHQQLAATLESVWRKLEASCVKP